MNSQKIPKLVSIHACFRKYQKVRPFDLVLHQSLLYVVFSEKHKHKFKLTNLKKNDNNVETVTVVNTDIEKEQNATDDNIALFLCAHVFKSRSQSSSWRLQSPYPLVHWPR